MHTGGPGTEPREALDSDSDDRKTSVTTSVDLERKKKDEKNRKERDKRAKKKAADQQVRVRLSAGVATQLLPHAAADSLFGEILEFGLVVWFFKWFRFCLV